MSEPKKIVPPWLKPKQAAVVSIDKTMAVPEPGSMLDYALRYAALGWHVFPVWGAKDGKCRCGKDDCKSPGKHPQEGIARRGQDDATTDPVRVRLFWSQDPFAGIGVHLKPSGLCAIDIDPRNGGLETIDQVESARGALVSDVMQFTQGGGEHRIFKFSGDGAIPGSLGPGIDVKYNGYVILAPTRGIHGIYDWEASSDPLEGAIPSPLPDWIRDIKSQDGGKVDAFASRHADPKTVAELRDALSVLPADDRDIWIRYGMALHQLGQAGWATWNEWSQKSPKFDPVDQARTWRSFRPNSINYESIFFDAQQAGWINPLAGGTLAVTPAAPEVVEVVAAEAKKAADAAHDARIELPPLPVPQLRELEQWISGIAENHVPGFSTVAALAAACTLSGRLYRSTLANWPSCMFALVGPSGVGKNYVQTGVERFLRQAGLIKLVAGDFYTHQSAVYSALRTQPSHICISDEFGENFFEARKNNNANKMTVFKALKKVYSSADHHFKSESYSKIGLSKSQEDSAQTSPVINPALTLVGLTTPQQFFSEIRSSHIEGGLMNRLIVLQAGRDEVRARTLDSNDAPEYLIAWARSIYRFDDGLAHCAYDMEPAPITVNIAPAALQRFNALGQVQEARSAQLDEIALDAMPMRWRENALRLGTALAACANPKTPTITGEIAEFCCIFVESCGERLIDTLRTEAGESEHQQVTNQLHRFLLTTPGQWVSRSVITRRFRKLKPRDLNDVLQSLVESELALARSTPTSGRPLIEFMAAAR